VILEFDVLLVGRDGPLAYFISIVNDPRYKKMAKLNP
jgi:hypothetical protein